MSDVRIALKKFAEKDPELLFKEDFTVEVNSTGILTLDVISGIGGLPVGKVIEIYGDQEVGKSMLSWAFSKELMANKKSVVWLDLEFSTSNGLFRNLGIDTNPDRNPEMQYLSVMEAYSLDNALKVVLFAAENGADLIVLDSIGGMTTHMAQSKDVGEVAVADLSRLVAPFLRRVTGVLQRCGCTLILINHSQTVIAKPFEYVDKRMKSSGGKMTEYLSSVRWYLTSKGKNPKLGTGIIKVHVAKGRFGGMSKREAELEFSYKNVHVVDEVAELINVIKTMSLPENCEVRQEKAGSQYYLFPEEVCGEKGGARIRSNQLSSFLSDVEVLKKAQAHIRKSLYDSQKLDSYIDESKPKKET